MPVSKNSVHIFPAVCIIGSCVVLLLLCLEAGVFVWV